MKPSKIKTQLVVTTALAAALFGYGRRAYAAYCTLQSGDSYLCDGASSGESISHDNASLYTGPSFSVNATGVSYGISLSGNGALSFLDNNGSTITAAGNDGIIVFAGTDDGMTPASITIDTDSTIISSQQGIHTLNTGGGTGGISITVNGSVTSTGSYNAIDFTNQGYGTTINIGKYAYLSSGDNAIGGKNYAGGVSIVFDGTAVSYNGIGFEQYGNGDVSITTGQYSSSTATGASTAAVGFVTHGAGKATLDLSGKAYGNFIGGGIFSLTGSSGNIYITAQEGSITKATTYGLVGLNDGTGSLTITADGYVSGGTAAIATKSGGGGDTSIYVGAKADIQSGTGQGIYAVNGGTTGDLTISVDGNVSADSEGIFADNKGADLTITTGAASTVSSDTDTAIYANNTGIGNLYIDVGYKVYGNNSGIVAHSSALDIVVEAQQTAIIKGLNNDGINTYNNGIRSTSITVDGDVSGAFRGIYARNTGNTGNLTVQTGKYSAITGGSIGIGALNAGTSSITVGVDGYVEGTDYGVYAATTSAGSIFISSGSTSEIVSTSGDAISVHTKSNKGGNIYVTAGGKITAYDSGIYAVGHGDGVTVETLSKSDITSTKGNGIRTFNYGSGETSITVNGTIDAYINGIYAYDAGTNGDIKIQTGKYSSINSTSSGGIHVFNKSLSGSTTATINGYLGGVQDGITIWNYSGGTASVQLGSSGYIHSSGGVGIGINRYTPGTIQATIDGKVLAKDHGLSIQTSTPGDINVVVSQGASVTSTNGDGLHVWDSTASPSSSVISVTVDGDISSLSSGVNIRNNNSAGGLTFATGKYSSIISSGDPAINVENHAGDLDMTLAGYLSGNEFGVRTVIAPGTTSATTHLTSTAEIKSAQMGLLQANYSAIDFGVTIDSGATVYGKQFGIAVLGGGGHIDTSGDISMDAGISTYAIAFANLKKDTVLNIGGGRIIGNVTELDIYTGPTTTGYSHVNIVGDFESEGDFYVSDLNVSKGATFTLGKGFTVSSIDDPIDIYGTFLIPEDPLITGDVDVHTGGTLDVHDVTTITGFLRNDGTVSIAHDGSVKADTMQTGTGTLYFGVDSVSDHGLLTIDTGAADLTGQTIKVLVGKSATFSPSDQIKIIDGAATLIGGPGSTAVDVWEDSPAWDFKIVDGTGISNDSDLYLVLSASAPPPSLDGAIAAATLTLSDNALNMTSERLSDLRGGERGGMTGISAGAGGTSGRRVWTQALGQYIHQGERQGIPGYTAQLMGGTFGVDTDRYLKNGVLGVAFSYGQSRIDAMNTTTTAIDIDSYQLTVYGDYNWPQGWYMTGMAAYSFNMNDSVRHDAGGAGVNATASFNSQQTALRGELGRTYDAGRAFFTPFTVANWVYYTAQDYTETGGGSANLQVENKGLNQVDLGIGGKAGVNLYTYDGDLLRPEIHAVYRRDLFGNQLSTTQTYVGSGAPGFTVQSPNPARDKFTLGTQLKYYAADGLEMTAAYDLELKQDYVSHTGLVRVGWRF